jgi:hypothetical protein
MGYDAPGKAHLWRIRMCSYNAVPRCWPLVASHIAALPTQSAAVSRSSTMHKLSSDWTRAKRATLQVSARSGPSSLPAPRLHLEGRSEAQQCTGRTPGARCPVQRRIAVCCRSSGAHGWASHRSGSPSSAASSSCQLMAPRFGGGPACRFDCHSLQYWLDCTSAAPTRLALATSLQPQR